MAAISALMVNDTALRKEPYDEERTPTTPRAPTSILSSLPGTETVTDNHPGTARDDEHEPAQASAKASLSDSQTRSSTSPNPANEDDKDRMDVDDEDQDGSDNDTEQGDPGSGSRKKKGQRFFCTGYPPCNLSFTRSEHLARHIRKHTGERPFQCHCNRRFSRLDNLRQHAQTVHVNEEIPTDSLAATGTRFQRQIRTDRVRPTGRPRSGTMSSTGTHSRGHSRNLSASSIGSTSSNYSTSTVDPRRRPPPILMADGRPKLGLETPSTPPPQFANFSTHSPGDIGTPTSATYSVTPNSPSFASSIGSPLTSSGRGGLFGGARTPTRRLSVPSGPHPYHSPYPPPHPSPFGSQTGPPSAIASSNPSTITSPTSSTFPFPASFGPPGEDWRRRTWHPSTYSGFNLNYNRPATSGLSYSQTPDAPQPAFAPNATAAAGQAPRLPGIESFDHVQQRPTTPPRLNITSAGREGQSQPSLMPPVEFDGPSFGHRRHLSADVPRQGRYAEVSDRPDSAATASTWVQETLSQIGQINPGTAKRKADAPHHPMAPPPTTASGSQPHQIAHEALHSHAGGNRSKRNGVSQSSMIAARTSPEDSASSDGIPTPGTSIADVHPAIMPSNGILESQHSIVPVDGNQNQCLPPPQSLPTPYSHARGHDIATIHRRDGSFGELNRLEALVAVATGEKNTTQAYR